MNLWTGLNSERLPVAFIDLDAFDRNIRNIAETMKAHSGSKTIRIATKSIRNPGLIKRIMDSGEPFKGLMCYSAEEIKMLAGLGMDDFLLAYPTLQSSDLSCLREVHESGKKLCMVVDAEEHLEVLSNVFRGSSRPFSILIDVDMSLRFLNGLIHLGVRRSPIRTVNDVFSFFNAISKFPELKFSGFMAYEAQVAGLPDRNPFKKWLNPIAHWIRMKSVEKAAALRSDISKAFASQAIPVQIFNGGGTGSLNFSLQEAHLTEVTAGSAFFSPHLFDYYSNIGFEPACFFALQAVRSSDPGFVTCQGGGYVASGEPGWDKVPKPVSRDFSLVHSEGCGEVQTPVRTQEKIALGSPLVFRHAKAGELAERFNDFVLVSEGKPIGREKTYRGMGHCFY